MKQNYIIKFYILGVHFVTLVSISYDNWEGHFCSGMQKKSISSRYALYSFKSEIIYFFILYLNHYGLQSYSYPSPITHTLFQHQSRHQCHLPSTNVPIVMTLPPFPACHHNKIIFHLILKAWIWWFYCCWLWLGYLALKYLIFLFCFDFVCFFMGSIPTDC